MFIDIAKIKIQAGNGGNGCRSFYRDRYTRHALRNGGDGGKGANVILRADSKIHTLLDFRYQQHFKAKSASHGSSNNKKGRDGEDLIIKVPCGTVVRDANSHLLLRDLKEDADEVIVAKGGIGGRGNIRTRGEAEKGSPGEAREVSLELKFIADVAIVGLPNAGKSSLLSSISNAKPKIADYPFTTVAPILGIHISAESSFVLVDVPGLIEGAHLGKGLGDKFLRHIERTKLVLQVIDVSVKTADPIGDYNIIDKELALYGAGLEKKPRIIIANKIDLSGWKENLKLLEKYLGKKIIAISCLEKKGLKALINEIRHKL
ncbi:MAG: GTPase ObgE [Candidatus Omnitrophota bacterium]